MSGEYGRQPCPDRILDDVGGAFSMGAVGGSIWHFLKGLKNSPRGERLLGGTTAVQLNAPRIGGSFAVWGGLFSTFDCALVALRKKEDPWNSIGAGFFTGGFLQLRAGPRSALQSAVFGGVLLGLIEGAGIMLNRMTAALPPPPPSAPGHDAPPSLGSGSISGSPGLGMEVGSGSNVGAGGQGSSTEGGSGSWWNLFSSGSKGAEESRGELLGRGEAVGPSKTEVLDSFDANPPPPAPEFAMGNDSWLKK